MRFKIAISQVLLLFCLNYNLNGQTISKGLYLGYEPMIQNNNYFFPGIYFTKNTPGWIHSTLFFHEVLIDVEDDENLTVYKVPVLIKNNRQTYIDSLGGFFRYDNASLKKYARSVVAKSGVKYNISGSLSECKKCKVNGSGVPRFSFLFYDVIACNLHQLTLESKYGMITFIKLTNREKAESIKHQFFSIQ